MTASNLIPRTCTEVATADSARVSIVGSQPLSAFRDVPAYVLLGEPGSGKTTEFEGECQALGNRAELVSARRFAKADIAAHLEWRNKVLFIDGLDETRVSTRGNTTALDEIQSRLDALKQPSFRISCRAADWFGPVDRGPLTDMSPDGQVTTLNLDPLDRSAVREHLNSEPNIGDPTAFIHETVASGLDFMLNNPLLLKLLIASASDSDGSPSSRREVFERSCRTLVTEHNQLHPRSAQTCSPETVLAAAGRLCAIQLLANKEGYALGSVHADVGSIPVAEVSSDVNDIPALDEAVSTNLFRSTAEQHIVPVHRHVAEYLGASYLVRLVDGGTVSAGRVCAALLSPVGSRVVTDLRGLAAWLGTLSAPARSLLIKADPVGMALYGDISEWPVADRRKLLKSLVEHARPEHLRGYSWFDTTGHRYRDATAWSFRSLCKPDMALSLTTCLDQTRLGEYPSHIMELVLRSVSEAEDGWLEELTFLVPQVECLMFDTALTPGVRLAAIAAFNRIAPQAEATERALLEVLEAADNQRIDDPDGEIAGTLLRLLYPQAVPPRAVWRHAKARYSVPIGGRYWNFWNDVLLEGSDVAELCQLLDGFALEPIEHAKILSRMTLDDMPTGMLVRVLTQPDEHIPTSDIYRWLCAIESDERVADYRSEESRQTILQWLSDHPDDHLALLDQCIVEDTHDSQFAGGRFQLRRLLFASLPGNFLQWSANQALARVDVEFDVACAFVVTAIRGLRWSGTLGEDSINRLRSDLASSPALGRHLDEYLTPSASVKEADRRHQQQLDEIRAGHERNRQERQANWSEQLREHIDELRANTSPGPNLHTLALAYFGLLVEVSNDDEPVDRIAGLIGDDPEILEAVVGALRDAPTRNDVPTVDRTVELTAGSKHDWLAFPVLAGLAIRESECSLDDPPLSDDIKRNAIAIYAAVALMPSQKPAWPVSWLHTDPALVLGVLHKCSVAAIKKGDTHLSIFNWLLDVEGLVDELSEFRLRLLRSISVRLPISQLPIVDELILRVARHPNTDPLRELATQKLRAKSMTDAQRVRWMTVDAIMSGGEALRLLDDFIGLNEKRARQLAEFLCAEFDHAAEFVDRLLGDEPYATLRTLVGIIGRNFLPREWKSGEVVSVGPAEEMSDLVDRWIKVLGGQPTEEAGAALDALVSDERLSTWHSRLESTSDQQRRLHSDTSYAPMDVADVIALLCNGPPANVADLHVLLGDHLHDLGTRISGDNSDLWRQFWADDRESQPKRPKHEESCRDALLAMLRNRLPEGVDAQPEGQYAADRRADIRVAFKDFHIPVEIKKNAHPDLWTAINDQLIANYTTDPETSGYGIYVVLWFGSEIRGYRRHPTDGYQPGTPDELERMLNESLSHEQRRKIGVVVLDVTKP